MLPLARELTPTCDVVVPDLPGFGRSARTGAVLDTREQAEVLAQLLEATDLRNVTLVASSYGCPVAIEAALLSSDRVDRLVLMGATGDPCAVTPMHFALRFARQFWREPLSFWLSAFRDLLDCGLVRAWKTILHLPRYDMLDALAHARADVIVLRGEHDAVCPQAWAVQLAGVHDASSLAVIDGAAHTAHIKRPQAVAAHVMRSLNVRRAQVSF